MKEEKGSPETEDLSRQASRHLDPHLLTCRDKHSLSATSKRFLAYPLSSLSRQARACCYSSHRLMFIWVRAFIHKLYILRLGVFKMCG